MKYKAEIGYLQQKTVAALTKKIGKHGIVKAHKITAEAIRNVEVSSFPNSGIVFVSNCDEEGKEIVDRYFEGWFGSLSWKEEVENG